MFNLNVPPVLQPTNKRLKYKPVCTACYNPKLHVVKALRGGTVRVYYSGTQTCTVCNSAVKNGYYARTR